MRARILAVMAMAALATATLVAQSTMNQVRLAEGENDINKLSAPVYDGSRTPPISVGAFTAAYDKKALFVRRTGGNMFTRGPEYKLNPAVDPAAIFAESLGAQAKAMGFRAGDGGWQISGTIRDLYLESRQIPYGSTLFYGFLDTQVQLAGPGGAKPAVAMRLHNYCGGYNAGMGRRDEAESCAAQLLIEGAQELLARLNRLHFKAPPSPAMVKQLTAIDVTTVDKQRPMVRAIALSGAPAAAAAFATVLPSIKTESGRAAVVDALAILGSPSAVSTLSSRYATEDEDPRWYTLKAMDYIGGDDAMKLVSTSGVNDKDNSPKRLAQRIVKK